MSAHSTEKEPDIHAAAPAAIAAEDAPEDAKIVEAANTDLAVALASGPPLRPLSARSIQLYLILLVAFMGSLANGFDGSVMSAVNGMEQYLHYFNISGDDAGGGVGTTTALIFGIYSIGSIVAVPIAGPVTDKLGRRGGMFVGAFIIIIGSLAATTATKISALLGGRFVLGLGVGIVQTAFNTFYYAGSILCTGITVATGKLGSTRSFRAPLAIQVVAAGILVIFSYLLPESPRWLLSVGRKDEAITILARYHGNDDPNSPLVQLEWREFEEAIKLDASDKRWWDYRGLFNTPNARYRTFMMVRVQFPVEERGLKPLGSHGHLWSMERKRTGILPHYFVCERWGQVRCLVSLREIEHFSRDSSQNARLTLNFVNTLVSASGALIATSLTDKVGRRKMWLWGTFVSACTLAIVTGCTATAVNHPENKAAANAAVAFIFLFGFFYSLAYTPLQALYPAEVLDYNTRAKGMALYALVVSCASFVNTYAGPIGLQRISWKFYIVYVVWDLFECVVVYFCVVETKGRTLEELEEIFSDPHPVRASLRKRKVAIVASKGEAIPVKEEA
ncbi:MFS domain-containing protein [Mycena kentingensis (nom. inval.)]|nr:MFS domain-containing protein [Mycena kentingensis (nom. inval.)]